MLLAIAKSKIFRNRCQYITRCAYLPADSKH